MRLSASEKQEIIHLVDNSDLGVNRTLRELGIHKRTFTTGINPMLTRVLMDYSLLQGGTGSSGIPSHGNRKTW